MEFTDSNLQKNLIVRYRAAMAFFIVGLILSGLSAFPLLYELRLIGAFLGIPPDAAPQDYSGLLFWVAYIREALEFNHANFPFLAYGTDWLAYGHLVIALFFFGPLFQPAQHTWILVCGIIACVGVIPIAIICGSIRGIPLFWRLIDCAFGVIGLIPLVYCLFVSRRLQSLAGGAAEPQPSS